MRMTRIEWRQMQSRVAKPLSEKTKKRLRKERVAKALRRALITSALPPRFEWLVTCAEGEELYEANTKSEVRAALKKRFGRVPPGTVITKTERQPKLEAFQKCVKDFYERTFAKRRRKVEQSTDNGASPSGALPPTE